ncbi:MAG: PAS domain-containing protein [Candidatus Competibacteraceae bacterium]|nr:PAS domain-containing protein [Candidatus Competibacteraceae bacterium]
MNAISQGVIITDLHAPDHPIIYANPGFLRITGYDAAEVLGRNCRFLQGPDTDRAVVAKVRATIVERRSCVVQILNYRKDGRPFWNALALSPIHDRNGEVTHFVGIQTDISEFKQLEAEFRQAQKMEAIGRLAGGLAHDFNNLLTVINGYSDMILHSMTQYDVNRAKVDQIRIAGDRAAALTRQLLAFSRKQMLQPVVLNLNSIVINLQEMLKRLLREDIYLATLLEPQLWSVRADPGQIEQVIMNLVVNARDAMPQGGRIIIVTDNVEIGQHEVEAYPSLLPGPHVMLAISDTGSGIEDAILPHLFEPFFTTKEPGHGTGLGLATVYSIVQQCGGIIDVYSKLVGVLSLSCSSRAQPTPPRPA